jgi:hypothetical protein
MYLPVVAMAIDDVPWNLSGLELSRQIVPHPTPHLTRVLLENAERTPQTMQSQDNESHLFGQAQARESHPLAPYAWEGTVTKSTNARQAPCGVAKRPIAGGTNRDASSTQVEMLSVPTGNARSVAPVRGLGTVTNAQGVERTITELKIALEHRRNRALTPYHHETWHRLLTKHQLLEKYPFIPRSLQFGFDAGISPINSTFTPDNSPTLYVHTKQYHEIMEREFNSGRYIGPASKDEVEELLGPFQSSPLSLVPKPGKAERYRAVHNFSFPRSPRDNVSSINYSIDANLFPCTWGTFATLCTLIWHLPQGAEASIRDVAEAYRTIPILPAQWPGLVVKLREPNQFAINTNDNFGLTSAGGIHGSVADAGADLFRATGIGPLSKWVDDHIFFRIPRKHLPAYNEKRREWHKLIVKNGGRLQDGSRYWFQGETMPDGRVMEFDEDAGSPFQDFSAASPRSKHDALFTYNDTDINHLSDALGIPWENSKTIPFSQVVPYLGFTWDIQARTVAIPSKKKTKYIDAIENWASCPTHALKDVQELYGKLLHASLVVPVGRAYLTNLEAMLGLFNNSPFVPHHAPRDTAYDLNWWKDILSSPILSRPIPGPSVLVDLQAYSDASSSVGVAITIGNKWRAWRLLPGWKSDNRDIGWAEAVGFELLVRTILMSETPGTHLKVYGDNRGVVEGWWKGRSKNRPTNTVFRRIHKLTVSSSCIIHTRYVPSKINPADDPSRGVYPPTFLLLPALVIPSELTPFITNFDADPLPTELHARQCGAMPTPHPKPVRDCSEPPECWTFGDEPQLWHKELLREAEDKR